MTRREDLDGQATSGRAVRRKNQRVRDAARIVARAGWLDAPLVFWTGVGRDVPRLADAPYPLRALLQDRLVDLPAGLYAVRLSSPAVRLPAAGRKKAGTVNAAASSRGPLGLEVAGVEAVTREKIAATARAIQAAAKYPRAATQLVGPVDRWRHDALSRLDACRQAVDGVDACRSDATKAANALTLEAGALWLGSVPPPSATLPEPALALLTAPSPDTSAGVARLAAVALGKRHKPAACHAWLAAWAATGGALDCWPAASTAWAAAAVGPEALAALAVAAPDLNDALAAIWADERVVAAAPTTTGELAGLARLLAAIATVRTEPDRRDSLLRRLAVEYLRLAWARDPRQPAPTPQELAETFRDMVLDEVYGAVREPAASYWQRLSGGIVDLAECWVGEGLLGQRLHAYVDHILASAAITLGKENYAPAYENPPTTLSKDAPPGSALDPAGAAAYVTVASRLQWKGAPDACETMAMWLESCRPVIQLARFWRDVLAVVPSEEMQFGTERAQHLTASLKDHARRVATELALGECELPETARRLLPAVLARGADATDRAFRRDLWTESEETLDAALRWVEATERQPRATDPGSSLPVPRRALAVAEPAAREALLAIGLRAWETGVQAREVALLLDALASAASRPGGSQWKIALPALVDIAAGLARRVLGPGRHPERASVDRVDVVRAILDVCARWQCAGFAGAEQLARNLADRWTSAEKAEEEWSGEDDERNELITRLSEGRVARVPALLRYRSPSRQFEWRAVDGWALVAAHPTARAWISACLDRPKLVARVIQLLERLALVARLDPGLTPRRLFRPLDRPSAQKMMWPRWVPPDAASLLGEVAQASAVAGIPGAMPGALQRLLDRGSTAERELEALRERARRAEPSQAERARLEKLERLSEDSERQSAGLSAELRKALPKQVALVGLAALESLVKGDLERRWREMLGAGHLPVDSAAWDNALHLLWSVKHNRRVLVRLLRRAAQGDRVWIRDLGPNRVFLDALAAAGLRPDEWLAERSLDLPGRSGPLTAYAATDPLEILQMGSLFGTCLSAGKFNAHAAVAAAVETNKRVLYVKDGAGRVLGRQLLALTADGELLGFTAYGAGSEDPERHGARVKLALELLALAIARASGARLMTAARVSSGLRDAEEKSLVLFCRGYVDSLERFDWWIEALAEAGPHAGEDDQARLRSLLERPVPPELDAREGPQWKRDELGWAASRALLWLGDEAPSLSEEQEKALGLGDGQRLLLGR